MMSNFQASSSSSKQKSKEEQAAQSKIDDVEDNLEKEIMCFGNTEASSATSSSVNINRHNMTYTIRPEEYSVIEEEEEDITSDWNPNDAVSESTQLDESMDKLSSSASSSSSSSSISYLLQMAQQMIANYPNEEQLAGMIAENYLNYIAELLREDAPMIQSVGQEQTVNTNDDSVILLESVGAQTSFSFEQDDDEEEEEKEKQ